MLFYSITAPGGVETRETFDHTNICGIDRTPDGCVINLSNGRNVECPGVDPWDAGAYISKMLQRFAVDPTQVIFATAIPLTP